MTTIMRLLYTVMICLLFLPTCAKRSGTDRIQARANAIVASMDDRQLAAQVLFCVIDGNENLSDHERTEWG